MGVFVGVLARLWTAVGKPLDAERLRVYRSVLGEVPLGLLERAVGRVLAEHKYGNVPLPGEVWEAVRKELGNPMDLKAAMEAWVER